MTTTKKHGSVREVEAANAVYAASFSSKGGLPFRPVRRFAILACMDSRMLPSRLLGLVEGDAHIIRNAGGRASDDAIRSLVISWKLLGTREIFVIHHTHCGMTSFTNETMADLLAESLGPAVKDLNGWRNTAGGSPGSSAGDTVDWMPFEDDKQALLDDVKRIRNHPLIPGWIPVYGYIYDVETGLIHALPEAMEAGAATA